MKFVVDKAIFEQFPEVKLGVVVGLRGDNSGQKQDIGQLLQKWQEERGKEFSGMDLASHERVRPWREAYSKFGAKPSKYNSSIEALLRRVSQGGKLPQINLIVDLYNALSLKHLLPFGAEDLDKVKGDIRLAVAKGDEKGKYIGSDSEDSCEPGEIAYVDDLGFICRRWNWREADRTKLTSKTKNFILVVEALPPAGETDVKEAIDDFVVWAKQQLGGDYKTGLVDKSDPNFEFDLASQGVALRSYSGISGEIQKLIKEAVKELGLSEVEFVVEHPAEEGHGDFSTNVAMVAAKQYRKNPRELAEQIAAEIRKKLPSWLYKVEVPGPARLPAPGRSTGGRGFINFYLSEHYLWKEVKRAVDLGEKYGSNQSRRGEKVMVEFTDPNPFKEFHIGHLYSNAVGESLCRLLEANGATVKRVNYQGDVGMHVAKALYGLLRIPNSKFQIPNLEKKPLRERIKILGEAYAAGAKAYEEDNMAKAEIEKINQQVYSHDPEIEGLYQKGRAWSLEYFETIYARLGTKFDYYYFESQAAEAGVKLVQEGLKRGIFEESTGAVIFPGEKYGLHTRVFINALGLPTYEAKELGLAPMKYKDWVYDRSVIVTGNEINEYFKVVIAAMKQVEPELGEKTEHIGHGMVKLPEGKMSSRTGSVLTGEWLLDEVKRRVMDIIASQGVALRGKATPLEREETTEMVAVGAVKYALLKSGIGQDVVFDVDKSVSLQGNSGPYLQYTYARTRSVLRKASLASQGVALRTLNAEEKAVLRYIYRFPEVVRSAGERYEPSQICTYLYELAQRFNTFYNKHTILGSDFRLALTAAVGQVIKNGLWLLGIKAPEKM